MLLVFPILAIICAPALWMVLGRPKFLQSKGNPEPGVKLSVVIPARDEEETIGRLLDSLGEEGRLLHEVIVVDDGSQDATGSIAEEKGARVVSAEPLPPQWKGKSWACQQGANEAAGDWLLFLDADTWLEPGGLEHILALTGHPDRTYSICPYHKIQSLVEELSSFFNVVMVAGVNAFGRAPKGREGEALFGQSLLISRQHFEQVGGYEGVKNEILENFSLAEHLQKMGVRCDCYLGRGVLSMRMFGDGFGSLWGSWKKGFTSGATQVAPRVLLWTSIWISGAMFVVTSLLVGFAPMATESYHLLSAIAYLLYAGQCRWAFRLTGSFGMVNALLFPVSLLFYQTLFFTATIERHLGVKAKWKGRDVS